VKKLLVFGLLVFISLVSLSSQIFTYKGEFSNTIAILNLSSDKQYLYVSIDGGPIDTYKLTVSDNSGAYFRDSNNRMIAIPKGYDWISVPTYGSKSEIMKEYASPSYAPDPSNLTPVPVPQVSTRNEAYIQQLKNELADAQHDEEFAQSQYNWEANNGTLGPTVTMMLNQAKQHVRECQERLNKYDR
jgi:hypothetical protein